jgi:predicted regulator of Ras-like GTPase activity (Roadblock/LC7/MglB family)
MEALHMASIREQLDEMVQVEGIKAVVVIGRDGFVIDAATEGAAMDAETLGAVISASLSTADMVGAELGLGNLNRGMVEFRDYVLLVNQLGVDAVLAVMADPRFMGIARHHVKKRTPTLLTSL